MEGEVWNLLAVAGRLSELVHSDLDGDGSSRAFLADATFGNSIRVLEPRDPYEPFPWPLPVYIYILYIYILYIHILSPTPYKF